VSGLVAIEKQGKPLGGNENYRFVSLLRDPFKIFERLVSAPVEPIIDSPTGTGLSIRMVKP